MYNVTEGQNLSQCSLGDKQYFHFQYKEIWQKNTDIHNPPEALYIGAICLARSLCSIPIPCTHISSVANGELAIM